MFDNVEEAISWIESRKRFNPKRNLENMFNLCAVFGNPESNKKIIHVAGTNGKGSTVAYLSNILKTSGYIVGMYTSPYVTIFNERIEINGKYISDDDVLRISNLIDSKKEEYIEKGIDYPSFFEFVTLMAFIYFSEHSEIDFVILEAGMGGTLDSTNVAQPLVTAITNISYDHQAILGSTLEKIALNKLGIVKPNVALFSIENVLVHDLFTQVTKANDSVLTLVQTDNIKNVIVTLHNTTFDYLDMGKITLSLVGRHQTENAAIVIEICKYLSKYLGYNITNDDIYRGLATTFWPGRLEVVSEEPLIILDGAHNIDGIRRLKEYITNIKKSNYIKIVFAVSADKEKDQMIELLDDIADEIVFTKFAYKRSDDADYLYTLSNNSNKRIVEDVETIYQEIIADRDKIIVCCGSLYFVSELRRLFK